MARNTARSRIFRVTGFIEEEEAHRPLPGLVARAFDREGFIFADLRNAAA